MLISHSRASLEVESDKLLSAKMDPDIPSCEFSWNSWFFMIFIVLFTHFSAMIQNDTDIQVGRSPSKYLRSLNGNWGVLTTLFLKFQTQYNTFESSSRKFCSKNLCHLLIVPTLISTCLLRMKIKWLNPRNLSQSNKIVSPYLYQNPRPVPHLQYHQTWSSWHHE